MTIGPDDLPEDPFAETGHSQLICHCTSETFHFVLTGSDTVKAVCAMCRKVAGEWNQVRGSVWPPPAQSQPPPQPRVRTSWAAEGQQPPPIRPVFPAGQCNAYLRGGGYDGQIIWLYPGTTQFVIAGAARYEATTEVHEGRIVYQHDDGPEIR